MLLPTKLTWLQELKQFWKKKLGSTGKQFLDALVAYWGTVSDLVQRQEHGAQKEVSNLVWGDGRRVVFFRLQ
jgi:hypothetical protein